MSGMAGNVTAFNTVWTYDIYQAHIRPGACDAHYLHMGKIATVAGIALSILAAYMATRFNNIMDMLQLIFAFVNAPALRHISVGHVLEARHGSRRIRGLISGMCSRRPASRTHSSRRRSRRNQRRLAGSAAPPISQRNGTKFLDGNLRVVHMFRGNNSRKLDDEAARRKRISRISVFTHAPPNRRTRCVVSASGRARCRRTNFSRRTKFYF